MEDYPLVSSNPLVQAAYEKMRGEGQSHNMAEMLATRSLPGLRTAATFIKKRKQQRQPKWPAWYYAKARAAGIDPDAHVYEPQLARHACDLEAWIKEPDDIRRICAKNQWSVESDDVNYKCTPIEAPADIDTKPYEAADDLVEKEVREIGKRDPGLIDTPKARERTTEDVRTKLAGNR